MTNEETRSIVNSHQHWLNKDSAGWEHMRADLTRTNLVGADLRGADLRGAHLIGADLSEDDLRGANLHDTDLKTADAPLADYRKGIMLSDNIVGYKKCKNDIIVTLEIPKGAVVFSINGCKCRTNRVRVIAIDGADRAFSVSITCPIM